MAYPTYWAVGGKRGANLCPRPSFPDLSRGAWSAGELAERDIGSGVMRNRLGSFAETAITLPGVPVAAASFRISALITAPSSGGTPSIGVRPVGSSRVSSQIANVTGYQWVTVTDAIVAGDTGSAVELYARTPTNGQLGIVAVRVDYTDGSPADYFDGSTADTAALDFTWDGAAFASPSSALAKTANPAPGGDTTPPSAPIGLTVTGQTTDSLALSWTASTDNVAVAGYNVFDGAAKVNTVTIIGTAYTVTGLSPSTTHTLTVRAVDAAGNQSAASVPVTGTTSAVPGEPEPEPEPQPEVSDAAKAVAAFLGLPTDAGLLALAAQAVPIITLMAKAYTRDHGFTGMTPNAEIGAVITTASARLVANPEQLEQTIGSVGIRGGFQGWTLAETFVLNRYRKRAQ